MNIYLLGTLILVQIFTPKEIFAASATTNPPKAPATAQSKQKTPIPAVGVTYTIGQLWKLINKSNPAQTSNFILPTLQGRVLRHEQCWPSQGDFLSGSVSAERVPFKGVIMNRAWVVKYQKTKVALHADPALIDFLVRDKRLTRAGGIDQQYGQVLLYFVLQINGKNYRFYLNDVYPGKISGENVPVRSIINSWDFQKSYRP